MKIIPHPIWSFDFHLPIYNWLYPTSLHNVTQNDSDAFSSISNERIKSRALYIHIPFCDTICSFCPFLKASYKGDSIIEEYVTALIEEIRLKARILALSAIPVDAIFIGGGTPSLLTADQILRIGNVIRDSFDTSKLLEFSFEMEIKSVNHQRLYAMREIGVTHGRFGLQTFNARYRQYFNITASVEQTMVAVTLMKQYLPYVSFDMLYGMNGQTDSEFAEDIYSACALGINNIDFYPINNYVSQISLHRTFHKQNVLQNGPYRKVELNILLNETLRGLGFLPHNGHGFVRMKNGPVTSGEILTDAYTFQYHKHIYGYGDKDLLGFGASAISIFDGLTVINTSNRKHYISSLKSHSMQYSVGRHYPNANDNKGLLMHLPYFGYLLKGQVNWSKVDAESNRALQALLDNGFVFDDSTHFRLTQKGWYWYVNLMYYLSPSHEKKTIGDFIMLHGSERDRVVEMTELPS